jgi:hypothetical protein
LCNKKTAGKALNCRFFIYQHIFDSTRIIPSTKTFFNPTTCFLNTLLISLRCIQKLDKTLVTPFRKKFSNVTKLTFYKSFTRQSERQLAYFLIKKIFQLPYSLLPTKKIIVHTQQVAADMSSALQLKKIKPFFF